jgi:hypothetical protein
MNVRRCLGWSRKKGFPLSANQIILDLFRTVTAVTSTIELLYKILILSP